MGIKKRLEGNKMEKKQMNVGDKYVKVVISHGDVDFEYVAYANDSDNPKAPLYRGKNVAIWVNTKKEKPKTAL